jgi:thioredoxin 1
MNRTAFHRTLTVAFLAAFIITGCVNTPDVPLYVPPVTGEVIMLDSSNFYELTDAPGRISMVDFYNPTCPPCQKMDSVVTNLGTRYSGKALIGKVNVVTDDTLQNAALIVWTPTFLFYNEGHEARRLIGVHQGDSLAMIIDSLLNSVVAN